MISLSQYQDIELSTNPHTGIVGNTLDVFTYFSETIWLTYILWLAEGIIKVSLYLLRASNDTLEDAVENQDTVRTARH